ncbi:hypothetical protein BZA70DRAFT_168259 [Myxozyma melibiosi]|uniref:RING-type E3 ubiquitin transferase n=1 Tax=Myxozyma melibiosi TaxID=54550 RepID=A0ABR1F7F8_9ASCO
MHPSESELHKEAGNVLFSHQDYKGAIDEYTKAIIRDASNPVYFTNRALCRLRVSSFEDALGDCEKALELSTNNMKANFYKGQALSALNRPNEALRSFTKAYELALREKSPSTQAIAQSILNAKKLKWEVQEERRLEKEAALLHEMMDILESNYAKRISEALNDEYAVEHEKLENKEFLEYERDEKISLLRKTFERSDAKYQKREVPDYMIDPISFNIFYDPVMSKSGRSFEKSVLLEHLKNNPFDPFTREHLNEADLRPNLALKAACEVS